MTERATDNVLVLYHIEWEQAAPLTARGGGHDEHHLGDLNAFELTYSSAAPREVLLADVLQHFLAANLDTNYRYYGCVHANAPVFQSSNRETSWIPLYSPTSVVPVSSNSRAYLKLVPASNAPTTPISQLEAFTRNSRSAVYTAKTLRLVESTMPVTAASSGSEETTRPSRHPSNSVPVPTRLHRGDHRESPVPTGAATSGATGLHALVREETVSAIKGAAKEVASAAARSFLSFAGSAIKNVSDVASTIASNNVVALGHTKVQVVRELAEGGFGKVYIAVEAGTNAAGAAAAVGSGKRFALKQMLCQNKDQEDEAHRELQALKRFSKHENIIQLLDYGSAVSKHHNGHRVVSMLFPLCSQGSCWDIVDAGWMAQADDAGANSHDAPPWPFPPKRALRVVLGVARALAHMHEQGYAHRDVKPHNILLSEEGIPLLTDFGSISPARLEIANRSQALDLEDSAARITSAAYRSPELTSVSHPSSVDERVDVWGLGCTMYCLAFALSPFESRRDGVLKLAILNGRYAFPNGNRMRDCVFPQSFCTIVARMLEHDIAKRPFAGDVAAMIERELQ